MCLEKGPRQKVSSFFFALICLSRWTHSLSVVDLVKPVQSNIGLGTLKIGDQSRREVVVVNRSKVAAPISLAPESIAALERNFVRCNLTSSQVLYQIFFFPSSKPHVVSVCVMIDSTASGSVQY